jgi:hypothetical protein
MSKNNIIFIIGFILFLMPLFLGFPSNWENFINIIFGIVLIGLSFSVAIKRRSSIPKGRRRRKTDTAPVFVDGAGTAGSQNPFTQNLTPRPPVIDTSL